MPSTSLVTLVALVAAAAPQLTEKKLELASSNKVPCTILTGFFGLSRPLSVWRTWSAKARIRSARSPALPRFAV